MKQYFVIITMEGEEPFYHVMTQKQLAETWETDDLCGVYSDIIAYSYNAEKHEMEKVNVYETAQEYIRGREEIQREYEEYTEMVNEYGYDYYPEQE